MRKFNISLCLANFVLLSQMKRNSIFFAFSKFCITEPSERKCNIFLYSANFVSLNQMKGNTIFLCV